MTKSKKKKKRLQVKIKKLIKMYPWLIPRNVWTGKVVKDYDWTWHEFEAMGPGWWKAFGLMLCEEIQQELHKFDFVNKFSLLQVKEKFGGLRIYNNGAPGNIHRITDKYEQISQNVCYNCGKPDVAITNAGWLLPLCKECFEKEEWHKCKYEDVIDPETPNQIPDSYTVRHYSKDGDWDETIDISDTVNEIRRQWQKRERKKLKARAKREAKISREHNTL